MPKTKPLPSEYILRLDRLPGRDQTSFAIERAAGALAHFYGFEEIIPSPLDDPHIYSAFIKAGFLDARPPVYVKTRSGEELILRVSGVLGAVRAYVVHRLQDIPPPVKLFARGDSFFGSSASTDTPGSHSGSIRTRQEWSVVMIGEESAVAEAEVIQVLWKTLRELGIGDRQEAEVCMNALGCTSCRGSFRSALAGYLRTKKARLCVKSRRDIKKTPTKIFSCAEERCRSVAATAPQTLDFLCEACKSHIGDLLEFMDEAGIPYFLDTTFFRDGTWFGVMIFEIVIREASREHPGHIGAGFANAVSPEAAVLSDEQRIAVPALKLPRGPLAQGGRISAAAGLIAGREIHAVAGTLLLEAVAEFLEGNRDRAALGSAEGVFLVQLGDLAKRKSFSILESLREGGIAVKESLGRDSIKSQLKIAERSGMRYALIMGQKEALDDTIIVREVVSGIQETVPQEKLIEFLKKKIKK